VFPTNFALSQARAAGFTGAWYILPHGVNPLVYKPVHKQRARRMIGLRNIFQESAFIFGNVNENAPRKRMDLSVEAWAHWWKSEGKPQNAYLYLHCNKVSPVGWDIGQLAKHHGIRGRVVTPAEDVRYGEDSMKYVYNSMDVQFTTSVGEGWGCTTMEGMACGTPQLIVAHSALGEWAAEGTMVVGKGRQVYAAQQQNVLLHEPDIHELQAGLSILWREPDLRRQLSRTGRALVLKDEYRWANIAAGFHQAFLEAMAGPKAEKTFVAEPSLSGPSGTGIRA